MLDERYTPPDCLHVEENIHLPNHLGGYDMICLFWAMHGYAHLDKELMF